MRLLFFDVLHLQVAFNHSAFRVILNPHTSKLRAVVCMIRLKVDDRDGVSIVTVENADGRLHPHTIVPQRARYGPQ
jgi:hypothetical protein